MSQYEIIITVDCSAPHGTSTVLNIGRNVKWNLLDISLQPVWTNLSPCCSLICCFDLHRKCEVVYQQRKQGQTFFWGWLMQSQGATVSGCMRYSFLIQLTLNFGHVSAATKNNSLGPLAIQDFPACLHTSSTVSVQRSDIVFIKYWLFPACSADLSSFVFIKSL